MAAGRTEVGPVGSTLPISRNGHTVTTFRKTAIQLAAVAGLGALALVANPAVGSAVVTGTATVTTSGDNIVVRVDGVSSPTLQGCGVEIQGKDMFPSTLVRGKIALDGEPGSGTFTTPSLGYQDRTVFVGCDDADGSTALTPPGGVTLAVSYQDWVRGGCKGLGSVIAGPFPMEEGGLAANLMCAAVGLDGAASSGSA